MRILQLGPLYNNHLRRWSANAVALGSTVYAAGHIRPGRSPVDLDGVAVAVDVLPAELLDLGTKRQLHWLRGVVERVGPNLVQAHSLPRWGYLAALLGACPLVVTPWGSDIYLAAGEDRERADRALTEADSVLARSPHMRHELIRRGVSAERIHEVDLGVDLDRFVPAPADERARLKAELGLPPGPTVLSFRAGTQLYNLEIVLDAFRILRKRIADAALVLVHGDAPLAGSVRASLRGLEVDSRVQVVGQVAHSEMPRYLRAADVGVSVPSSDGSPSSVWEALACGLPLVLSDLPQIEERLGRSVAVRLVEPSRDAVASALAEIIGRSRLRERMAQAGRDWAIENIDEGEQIERLGRAYAATTRRSARREHEGLPLPSAARRGGSPAATSPPPATAGRSRRLRAPGRGTAAEAPPDPS
jgi:glycosyltransferase involved in cell wall biosynthesis